MASSSKKSVFKQPAFIEKLRVLAASHQHPAARWALRHALRLSPMLHVLYLDMKRSDLFKHASAMAYVTLLSIVPSLAALFAIISLFSPLLGADSQLLTLARGFILNNLAAGSGEQVIGYLDHFIANLDMQKIGMTGFIGVLMSLVLLLRQIEMALNLVWEVEADRSLFRRFFYFWSFLTLGALIMSLAIGVLTGSKFKALLSLGSNVVPAQSTILTFLSPWIGAFLFFLLLYKIVPNCYVSIREAITGSIAASLAFNLAAGGYGYYVQNLTRYQNVYGAVAAIPVFLLWLYIMWLIILLGAVLARRSALGFPTSEELAKVDEDLAPIDRQRTHHLRSVIPVIALVAIYRRHAEGTGDGLSGIEITTDLGLPASWVAEALSALESAKLVVGRADVDDMNDPLRKDFYPTTSADMMVVARMIDSIAAPTKDWLNDWAKSRRGGDVLGPMNKLWNLPHKNWNSTTIAELLTSK